MLEQPFAKAPAGLFAVGGTYGFQGWFRDAGPSAPCSASSNLSNSYVIHTTP